MIIRLSGPSAERAHPAALAAADDLLAIHGCDETHRATFGRQLSALLASADIVEIRLYGAKSVLHLRATTGDGHKQLRTFEGHGCQLSPGH